MNTSPKAPLVGLLFVLWTQFGEITSQCLSRSDACFPPVPCEQGEKVSNPSDCESYQVCLAPYEWVIDASDCQGASSHFSNSSCTCLTSNACVDPWECPVGTSVPPRNSAPCFLEPTECTSTINGYYVPDAYYCSKYFECDQGIEDWVSMTCPPGEYFDETLLFLPQPCRADIGACERIAFDQCFPYTGPTTTTILITTTMPTTTVPTTTVPTTTVPTTTVPTTTVPTTTVPTTNLSTTTLSTTTVSTTTVLTTTVPATTVSTTTVPITTAPTTNTVRYTAVDTTTSAQPLTTTVVSTEQRSTQSVTTMPSSSVTSTQYISTTTHPFSADACEPLYACNNGEKVAHKGQCNLFFECVDGSWEEKDCEVIDSGAPYYNPDRGTCQIQFWVDCDVRCHTDGIRISKMTRNIAIIATMGGIVITAIVLIAVLCTRGTSDSYDCLSENAYSHSGVTALYI